MIYLPSPESVANEAAKELEAAITGLPPNVGPTGKEFYLSLVKAVYSAIDRCTTQKVTLGEAPK